MHRLATPAPICKNIVIVIKHASLNEAIKPSAFGRGCSLDALTAGYLGADTHPGAFELSHGGFGKQFLGKRRPRLLIVVGCRISQLIQTL